MNMSKFVFAIFFLFFSDNAGAQRQRTFETDAFQCANNYNLIAPLKFATASNIRPLAFDQAGGTLFLVRSDGMFFRCPETYRFRGNPSIAMNYQGARLGVLQGTPGEQVATAQLNCQAVNRLNESENESEKEIIRGNAEVQAFGRPIDSLSRASQVPLSISAFVSEMVPTVSRFTDVCGLLLTESRRSDWAQVLASYSQLLQALGGPQDPYELEGLGTDGQRSGEARP